MWIRQKIQTMSWSNSIVVERKRIRVSVGVLIQEACVLVARRHFHQHQGNLWEFPGGKIEIGESPESALKRELKEEINIEVSEAELLFSIEHDYETQSVELIVFQVIAYQGDVFACEGQPLQWLPINELDVLEVPQANQRIVEYLKNLP